MVGPEEAVVGRRALLVDEDGADPDADAVGFSLVGVGGGHCADASRIRSFQYHK